MLPLVSISVAAQRVWSQGREVVLTWTEFNLLLYLAQNSDRFLPVEMIYERVWGGGDIDFEHLSHNVYVVVSRVRKKLDDAKRIIIQGRKRLGYMVESHFVRVKELFPGNKQAV